MPPQSIRDPARRAEAERYLRTSGARLRFWLSCLLLFPMVNLGTLILIGAFSQRHRAGSTVFLLTVALLAGLETRIVYGWSGTFAPRPRRWWTAGGAALVIVMTVVAIGVLAIVALATNGAD